MAKPGDRTPPYNLDAEASLLGAGMLKRAALEVLARECRPLDFYKPEHRHVATVLIDIYEQDTTADPSGVSPADVVTVAEELVRRGQIEDVGGPSALITLQSRVPATTNAHRYAAIVHELATARRLISAADMVSTIGYEGTEDVHAAVIQAQALLDGVASQNGSRTYSTMIEADVAALLAGDLEPEEPDFCRRDDGKALIYAGKMHVFQSEPSAGKTFLALFTVKEILELGGSVVYLDYEDTDKGLLSRLLAIGCEPELIADGFRPLRFDGAFGVPERHELDRVLARTNPDLVVIDGVAEALARDGLDEDRARDVVDWTEKLPRPVARTGAAVVMLDHVVKDREKQGRTARGSGHKLAAVDGATYALRVVKPFSRDQAGQTRLVITKDRPGAVGAISTDAALMTIDPHANGTRTEVGLVVPSTTPSFGQRPTRVMAQIMTSLAAAKAEISASTLKKIVKSKPQIYERAYGLLVAEGYIAETAKGRGKVLRILKPYEPEGDHQPELIPVQTYEGEGLGPSDPGDPDYF